MPGRAGIILPGPPARAASSQVELMHRLGLGAPEPVELCYELNKHGFDLPLDRLDPEECAQILYDQVKI